MNIHETITFIHIYMPTHKHIHDYMYTHISTDILTRLLILLHQELLVLLLALLPSASL